MAFGLIVAMLHAFTIKFSINAPLLFVRLESTLSSFFVVRFCIFLIFYFSLSYFRIKHDIL